MKIERQSAVCDAFGRLFEGLRKIVGGKKLARQRRIKVKEIETSGRETVLLL